MAAAGNPRSGAKIMELLKPVLEGPRICLSYSYYHRARRDAESLLRGLV